MKDWLKVWEEDNLGFHQSEYNKNLVEFFPISEGKTVLVPLCGKSKDMLFLEETGHHVLGVELSPIACQDFFKENNIEVEVTEYDNHTVYKGIDRNITLLQGDLFQTPIPKIDLIYDRASMVALHKELRKNLSTLFKAQKGAKLLMITFEYDQSKVEGPPYRVDRDEIHSYFSQVEILKVEESTALNPRFAQAGVDIFTSIVSLVQL